MSTPEIENMEFSVEDCVRWAHKLDVLSKRFLEHNDGDNARLMHVCSALMQKLAFDVECHLTGSPFPVKGGEA